jgi:DnaJ-class molecular chaperone
MTLSPNAYRTKLRKQGYVTCPACDGFGKIGNRFTYRFARCEACNGLGMVQPANERTER